MTAERTGHGPISAEHNKVRPTMRRPNCGAVWWAAGPLIQNVLTGLRKQWPELYTQLPYFVTNPTTVQIMLQSTSPFQPHCVSENCRDVPFG